MHVGAGATGGEGAALSRMVSVAATNESALAHKQEQACERYCCGMSPFIVRAFKAAALAVDC